MSSFFEEAPLPYQSLDEAGRVLAVNRAWEEYLGYQRDDVQGHLITDFVAPGQEDKLRSAFDAFMQSGAIEGFSVAFQCKDGSPKVALINGRVARDQRGQFIGTRCILSDITERVALEASLQRSEESYRLAMDAVQDGVWDWDVQSGRVEYSPGWRRILGENGGPSTYANWADRLHPEDKARIQESLRAHLAGRTAEWTGEHRLRHANGGWLWVLGRGRVVERDPDARALRMVGTMTDISKRKLTEMALRQSEEKHRFLFNSVGESITVFDRDGNCELANAAAAELFGIPAEEMSNKSLADLYKAHCETFSRRVEHAFATGTSEEFEDALQLSQKKCWLYSRIYPVADEAGATRSALIISQDVSERRHAQEALRESESRLRALINATSEDVVVLLNAEMQMEIANERAALGFGRTVEELTGQPIGRFMPAALAESRRAYARKVLRSGKTVRFEDQRAGRWYDNNMCPVLDEDGKASAVAIFARDITERRLMEASLAKAKDEAERANVAKTRFLAAANHDLRQPLHALKLLVGTLLARDLDPGVKRLVLHVREAMGLMETMLTGLLDISKLEAGSFQPEKITFPAGQFLSGLRQQFQMTAQEAGTRLRVAAADATLYTDPFLLGRIVQNFISNAIRHAHSKSILVGCRRIQGGRRIEVWDDGVGISEDEQQQIFDEFYQAGPSRPQGDRGLGLGLSIARGMAELLGLELGMRSDPGKGSVFYVTVPVVEETVETLRGPVAATSWPEIDSGWILVVDDDGVVLRATRDLLTAAGYQVVCADTAPDAVALATQRQASLRLAILDYRLPEGWDGIKLAQRLFSELDRKLPVILVTGDTAAQRLREVQESGLTMLHKPVDPSELQSTMQSVLTGTMP